LLVRDLDLDRAILSVDLLLLHLLSIPERFALHLLSVDLLLLHLLSIPERSALLFALRL
jgi:hypothetical protein